jgi:hypothetical protein
LRPMAGSTARGDAGIAERSKRVGDAERVSMNRHASTAVFSLADAWKEERS